MWQHTNPDELYHYGKLGMKWGVRRARNEHQVISTNKSLAPKYAEENKKSIRINSDGSKTIPSGFMFNRVGKSSLDINESGALYVSHGKEDAARYIKSLGPTTLGKLLGTYGDTVQHISVKKEIKMASDLDTAKETANLLLSNEKLFESFNKSFYSVAVTKDFHSDVSKKDVEEALENPSGKAGQKLTYGVSSLLGDGNYADEAKTIYEHFRSKGYDAIPDIHDSLSGTSKTAIIVINPDKLEITSTTRITKDVMKAAKNHVKSLEKLKVSELIT